MNVFKVVRTRLHREWFQPTLLGVIFIPVYIVRHGLFSTIRGIAPFISGNILDFGCGSKPYESLFARATSYLGVDLQATGHDHNDSKVDVFYDGQNLPFSDAQFDAVVSFEVFEHVFNLSRVLDEIGRVTRSEGYLLISIPFAWKEHEIPYDFARYTSFGIAHILRNAGYEILESRKTTTYILTVFQMLIAYIMQITVPYRLLRYLSQICVIFPCTLIAYLLNALLPSRYEYYCNVVVLAKKRAAP